MNGTKNNEHKKNGIINSIKEKKKKELHLRTFSDDVNNEIIIKTRKIGKVSPIIAISGGREEIYFKSNEYKAFRKKLLLEIKKQMPKMSESVKNAMYLRFFKNLSIGGVARELGISKGAAQTSIQRGCKYIKDFLDADIKFQNRKEREKFTKNKY